MSDVMKSVDKVLVDVEGFVFDYETQLNPETREGETEFLKNYDPTRYGVTPEQVVHTVDNVIFVVDETDTLQVLLIKRLNHPFKNFWCTPGGFVDDGETLPQAAFRELIEETGVEVAELQFLGVYNHPGRDPRMRNMVTHAFVTVLPDFPVYEAADDAAEAQFIPVVETLNGTVQIGFDHQQIIFDALNFLSLSFVAETAQP